MFCRRGRGIRVRLRMAAAMVVVVALGIATKLYGGPGVQWVQGNAGGFFYVAFFTLLLLSIRPGLRPLLAATIVFVGTSALEVLQLWHPPILQGVRSTFVGQALLGGHFEWIDIPFYAGGALATVGLTILLGRVTEDPSRQLE